MTSKRAISWWNRKSDDLVPRVLGEAGPAMEAMDPFQSSAFGLDANELKIQHVSHNQNPEKLDPGSKYKPWLILIGGCPLHFSGDSDHFWGEHPPNNGTGLLILGQHYSDD